MTQYPKVRHFKLQVLVALVVLFVLPLTAPAMLAIVFFTPFAVAFVLVSGAVYGRFALLLTAAFSLIVIAGTAVKSLQF